MVMDKLKRRRHNGGQYEQLEDDTDSLRSSISRRQRSILCDKCWATHTRRRASRRCLTCKQNLCGYCAKTDESRRRSWFSSFLMSCVRFLFLKAFKRHAIVDLDQVANSSNSNASENDGPQPLFRKGSRSSSCSHQGRNKRHESSRDRNNRHESSKDRKRDSIVHNISPDAKHAQRRYYCPNAQALYRAYSFDKHLNRRKSGDHRTQNLRRTRSAERLPNKEFVDRESEFRDMYHQNWEKEPFDFHRAHMTKTATDAHNQSDLKENANSNQNGPSCNDQTRAGGESKERRFKRGKTSRRGIKHVADVFPDKMGPKSSEYFKSENNSGKYESGKQKDAFRNKQQNKSGADNPKYFDVSGQAEYFEQKKPQQDNIFGESYNRNGNDCQKDYFTSNSEDQYKHGSEPVTPYIVEEPPDSCPVCLENIPSRQARRLTCSHTIHTCCLIELLNKMDFDFGVRCPVCNQISHIKNYYNPRYLWYKEFPVVKE